LPLSSGSRGEQSSVLARKDKRQSWNDNEMPVISSSLNVGRSWRSLQRA